MNNMKLTRQVLSEWRDLAGTEGEFTSREIAALIDLAQAQDEALRAAVDSLKMIAAAAINRPGTTARYATSCVKEFSARLLEDGERS